MGKQYDSQRCLYRVRRACLSFLSHPYRPRWLGVVVIIALITLFTLSRLPAPTTGPCALPHLPASMEVIYCGSDLIAAQERSSRDLLVVYDGHDRGRTAPHSYLDRRRKAAGPAHMQIADLLVRKGARDVLALGLGGAAVPYLIVDRCDSCHVVGVDRSADALHIARQYVKADDGVRLKYVLDDVEIYVKTVPPASYDAVVVDVSVGMMTPEFVFQASFLGAVHRLLRDGGRIVVCLIMSKGVEQPKLQLFSALSKLFASVSILEVDESEPNFLLQATK